MKYGGIQGEYPTQFTGAISELLVCIDLIRRSYYVFRSLTSNCPCDLLAMKDGKVLKIEVKTASKSKVTGKILPDFTKLPWHEFDVFAAVIDGEVQYIPELPE